MLKTTKEFINFSNNKLVLLRVLNSDDNAYYIHHNVLINQFTTFKDYWNEIKDKVESHTSGNYLPVTELFYFEFIVLDIDDELKVNPILKLISNLTN